MRITIVAVFVLVACEAKPPSPSPSPSLSPSVSEWTDFYGIQYKAPPGTTARITRSVLPGPGGRGGSPVDERPYVTLSMAGPHGFHVTITKLPGATTLDATKALYVANQLGTNHTGASTPTGWELTYQTPRSDDPAKTSTTHLIYVALGGGHYECSYDEQSCPDPKVAEAICRSLRTKR